MNTIQTNFHLNYTQNSNRTKINITHKNEVKQIFKCKAKNPTKKISKSFSTYFFFVLIWLQTLPSPKLSMKKAHQYRIYKKGTSSLFVYELERFANSNVLVPWYIQCGWHFAPFFLFFTFFSFQIRSQDLHTHTMVSVVCTFSASLNRFS